VENDSLLPDIAPHKKNADVKPRIDKIVCLTTAAGNVTCV